MGPIGQHTLRMKQRLPALAELHILEFGPEEACAYIDLDAISAVILKCSDMHAHILMHDPGCRGMIQIAEALVSDIDAWSRFVGEVLG